MHRSKLRHQIRKLRIALDSKDKSAAQVLLAPTFSLIEHSIHKGILHSNTAARYKSRLSQRFNQIGETAKENG
jgi:small subunit ribosomal protein S20